MQISNGLEHLVSGVLLSILNLIHVALVDTDSLSDNQADQSLLQTQLCNDCSKGLLTCFSLTLDGATHVRIIMCLTLFRSLVITKELYWSMIYESNQDS